MGFFSQDCKGCGHSIRSAYSVNKTSAWMTKAVALTKDGDRMSGEYDGYGRLESGHGEHEDAVGFNNEVWHRACWKLAGKPEYTGPSRHASDQGHFVGEYDPPEPKTVEEMQALKAKGDSDDKAHRDFLRKMHEEFLKEKAERDALDSAGL